MAAGSALRATALAALAAGAFLFLAAADLALRSRSALAEARKYEAMAAETLPPADEPDDAGAGTAEAGRGRDLREARASFLRAQSSRKLAYIWYKTAAEDFNFRGNPWAAEARAKLPGALAAWRAELAASGVKAEPWMTR
ncbi:MAG: hypothetical protein ACYC2I_03760 [Elusimicrobiales bacterium]